MANAKKLHWYGGSIWMGAVLCGKGANRVRWTDRTEAWNDPAEKENLCPVCDRTRILNMLPTP